MKKIRTWVLSLIALAALAALSGCDNFTYYDLIDKATNDTDPDLALQISPISATVPAGAYLIFTARGGTKPYVYSRVSGNGTVEPDTGLYSAPTTATVDIIRVTDSTGTFVDAQVVVVE